MSVFIRFECGSEDRMSLEIGPYPYIQATFDVIRAGENGEIDLAVFKGDRWVTQDGQTWTDFVIAEHKNDNLETPRMLVLSTAHITKATDWNFGEHTDDVPGNYYPLPCGGLDGEVYGYLIPCGPDIHWSHMVSADLVAIRKVAEGAGCTWIRLDRDAPHVPGLPTYEW